MYWTLTDAKNRLSEVLDRADKGEVQTISRRGREFVLVRADEYRALSGDVPTLINFLIDAGPRFDDDICTMPRDTEPTRGAPDSDDDEAAA